MLITEQVYIKWSKSNKKQYVDKGYIFTQYGDIFLCKANDLPKYSKVKIKVKCDYCGEIIETTWANRCRNEHTTDVCKHCRQKRTSENTLTQRRLSLYNRALEFCESCGYELITNIDDVSNSSSIVSYKCPKHGTFETKIYALVSHHGCKECQYEGNAKKRKLNIDNVEKAFRMYGSELLNKDEYTGWADKNLKATCSVCGNVFITSFNSFTKHHGQLCETCRKTISVGESTIEQYLKEYNIQYIPQKRFEDCKDVYTLPFDFYLPDDNIAIEYNGEQHYNLVEYFGGQSNLKYVQNHDMIKKQYCIDNNIKLIIIPYWDINNIDTILDKEFILHDNIV